MSLTRAGILPGLRAMRPGRSDRRRQGHHWLVGQCQVFSTPPEPTPKENVLVACSASRQPQNGDQGGGNQVPTGEGFLSCRTTGKRAGKLANTIDSSMTGKSVAATAITRKLRVELQARPKGFSVGLPAAQTDRQSKGWEANNGYTLAETKQRRAGAIFLVPGGAWLGRAALSAQALVAGRGAPGLSAEASVTVSLRRMTRCAQGQKERQRPRKAAIERCASLEHESC